MKNNKWFTYTLGTLITLVVLTTVAGISYGLGMTRNPAFLMRPGFRNNFSKPSQEKPRNSSENRIYQTMPGNPHDGFDGFKGKDGDNFNQGFDRHRNDHRGGMLFFAPLFGLVHLILFGFLLWGAYKLVKNSGWRLTRDVASKVTINTSKTAVAIKGRRKQGS